MTEPDDKLLKLMKNGLLFYFKLTFILSQALSGGLDQMTSKGSSNLNYSGFVIVILHFHFVKTHGAAQGRAGLLPNHVLLST